MNKKIVKIILIISGVLVLSGLGIYGYKYIKNRNSYKNTNENESKLREISSSIKAYDPITVGDHKLNVYHSGPVRDTSSIECRYTNYETYCKRHYYIGTIYIDDTIKLKSSWILYILEKDTVNPDVSLNKSDNISASYINSNLLLLSINTRVSYYYAGTYRILTLTTYTKIFDINTGDLIYEVPTNSNVSITGVFGYTKNMNLSEFSTNGILYYLTPNYDAVSSSENVTVHKVVFNSDNTWTETTSNTSGTIAYGS